MSFFSTMHSECPLVRERSEGGSLDRGRGRANPGEIVLSSRSTPSWERDWPGTPTPRASGKAPGRGPTERIQGVSGTAAGGQRDRSPRKPMGPGKFQTPCVSLGQFLRQFSPRGQASVPMTRNRGSGLHLLPIFSEDALGKSKWPIRDGFPGEGGRPTAHHRLKIPQGVLGLFPHTPMR